MAHIYVGCIEFGLVEIELDDKGVIVLPESYSALESSGQHELRGNELITEGGYVKFITKDYVEKTRDEYFFILPRLIALNSSVQIYLPENHILSDNLVFPKNYNIFTNGKNIILEWEDFNESEIIIFYKGVPSSNLLYYIMIGVVIVIAFILFYFQYKKFRGKMELVKKRQNSVKQKLRNLKQRALFSKSRGAQNPARPLPFVYSEDLGWGDFIPDSNTFVLFCPLLFEQESLHGLVANRSL